MSDLLLYKTAGEDPRRLFIDDSDRSVYLDGTQSTLTEQEYLLLCELALHAGEPVSRAELLRTAWGYQSPGDTRTVDVHIQRLRRKIGFRMIDTIYRYGYRLRAYRV